MTHLSDGSSENSRTLVTCMLNISQHGSGIRALKNHESLGCRALSAQRLAWETALRQTAEKETELLESRLKVVRTR